MELLLLCSLPITAHLPSHIQPLHSLHQPVASAAWHWQSASAGRGKPPPPSLLVNLPTDCRSLLAVHWQGCLQQLSDELAAIKALMPRAAIDPKLDCFVWHSWWATAAGGRMCCWHSALIEGLGSQPRPAAKTQQVWDTLPAQQMHAGKLTQQVRLLSPDSVCILCIFLKCQADISIDLLLIQCTHTGNACSLFFFNELLASLQKKRLRIISQPFRH